MKYNDEFLSPAAFECMAKEYLLKLKDSQMSASTTTNKIQSLKSNLQTNLAILKNFRIDNINKKRLDYIINKIGTKKTTQKTNNNYCQILNSCIHDCCKICELMFDFQNKNQIAELNDEYKKIPTLILEIIPIFSQMYGECKYRAI